DRGHEGRRRRARGGGAGVPRLRRAALVPRHARPRGCRGARRRRHRGRRERGGRAAPSPGRGGRDRLPGGAVRRAGRRRGRGAHARAAREARGGRRRLSPRMDRPLTVAEIDHVVIRCRDQARALDFYTRVLGLREERRLEAIGLIQLRAGAGMIDLVPADPPPSHEGRNGGAQIVEAARMAERAGFDWVSCSDHVAVPVSRAAAMGATWFDAGSTLAFVAGATTRIRLLSHVLVLPYRHPLVIAKQYGT